MIRELKHPCKSLKYTWHRKNVTGKARQIQELWTSSGPPLQWSHKSQNLPVQARRIPLTHSQLFCVTACIGQWSQIFEGMWMELIEGRWTVVEREVGCCAHTAHVNAMRADLWWVLSWICWIGCHHNQPKGPYKRLVDPILHIINKMNLQNNKNLHLLEWSNMEEYRTVILIIDWWQDR